MASPSIEQIASLAAALGLGGIVTKGLEWWGRRQDAHRREPAAMTRASAELMDSLSDGGKELLDEFRREFRYLRGRVAELQAEVDEAKRVAEAAKGDHARCQAEVEALKAQIARLAPIVETKP
jgi:chromosome segregation ATPase